MKKILNYILIGMFISFAYNCEEDDSTNLDYVTFQADAPMALVDQGTGSTDLDLSIFAGSKTGSDRTYNILVDTDATTTDPSGYSVPSTVTIPANANEGIITIQFNEVGLTFGGTTLVLMFEPTANLIAGGSVTMDAALGCPNSETTVDLIFDNYGSEVSWTVTDSNDDVMMSGGGYADGDASASTTGCLLTGSYTLTVNDAFGDGMSAPGAVSVVFEGAVLATISGAYGDQGTESFTIN